MQQRYSLEILVSKEAGYADAGGTMSEKAKEAFDSLGALLTEAIEPFREKLNKTTAAADEIELKLDLALTVGSKWVVVSAEGGATVSVKLIWKQKKQKT